MRTTWREVEEGDREEILTDDSGGGKRDQDDQRGIEIWWRIE